MILKKLLLIVAMISYAPLLLAQAAFISGRITDQTGLPLPGANVIAETGEGTATNILGTYKLKLPPGDHVVTVSFVGYETTSWQFQLKNGEMITKDFSLAPSSVQLGDVVISTNEVENLKTISAFDIKLRPVKTSQDILRSVPGLFIAQHAGGGKAEQIFLRGFDIDHGTDITISVDGMPVNMVSHAHGQGYSDLHFLIPETIKQVRFNKGPYYADQGDFNTAGFAEFNTKTSLDKSMIKLEGGQFGTLRSVAMVDLLPDDKINEDFYLASEFYLTDGYFDSDQNFSRLNLFGKYTNHMDGKGLLQISASTFTSKWDASGQIPERAVRSGLISRFGAIDDTEGGQTSRSNLNIKYVKPNEGGNTVNQQLFISKYDFNLVSNFTFFLNDPINGDQITQGEDRIIYGYKASVENEKYFGNNKLTSEIGGGFRYDDINDIHLSRTKDRKEILQDLARGDIDQFNMSGFVSETLDLNNLSLNGSLRYDYFVFDYVDALKNNYKRQSEQKGVMSPKVNVNYKLTNNTNVFIKAGMGFHSNDTRVVVAQQGNKILPKAYGVDFGATFKPLPHMVVNTSLWYLDLEQEFVYVGDEAIVEPSGKTRRKGIDLSMRFQVLPWLFVDTDVNFTDPKAIEENEGNDYIPLAPTFTSIGGLSFTFENGINGSIRYRYLGDRPANEDNSLTADGYFLLDAVLNYSKSKYAISLSAENILNSDWKEAQFETESRLFNETAPVNEIHFTPGSPLFFKASVSYFF